MKKLFYPAALKPNDMVALTAPSSPVSEKDLKIAVKSLKSLGLKPIIMDSCHQSHGYLSGHDKQRADDLNRAFSDKRIKGIFCLRGGYGSARLLPLLDFNSIKNNPKVFIGYSDITALHISINKLCGFITFHGPMPSSDYTRLDSFTMDSMKNFLFSPHHPIMLKNPCGEYVKFLNPETAKYSPCCKTTENKSIISGIVTGGNLSLITSTLGSPYEINTKNKILFIEEIGESPYRLDRAFTSLALSGKFRDCSAIILGTFSKCEDMSKTSLSLPEIIEEVILPWKKPTLFNLRAGHIYPQITIPIGGEILINVDNNHNN